MLQSESDGSGEEAKDDPSSTVPKWLNHFTFGVPAEVQQIVREKNDSRVGRKLTMFDTAGPAVRLLWPATVVHIVFAVTLPCVARPFTHCETDGKSVYPGWLWLGFLPFVLTMLTIEWRCFTYTVVPMLQWIQNLEMPLWETPPFSLWLVYTLFVSVLTHMDVMTQGLFLATTLHRFHCPGFGKTRDAWHQVWGNSILSWMAWGSSLETLVIVSWGVFVLQLVLFALHAMPVQPVSFACQSEKQGYLNVAGFGYVRIWHADALKDLASSNRMAMVSAGHLRLSVKRAHQELQAQPPNDTRFLHILKMELRHLLLRIVLVNLCTNCTKIEVQTTIFALGRFDSDGTLDQEGFLCITLAHLTSLQALQVIVAGLLAIRSAQEELEGVRETVRASRESKEESSEIFRLTALVWLIAFICMAIQAHSLAKLVAAFVCEDAVWNFPNRCVDIGH